MLTDVAACATIPWEGKDGVPRMLRSAPRKRRDALLIRGHLVFQWVPALRRGTMRRTRVRDASQYVTARLGTRYSPELALGSSPPPWICYPTNKGGVA